MILTLPVYQDNWVEGFDVFVIDLTPELAKGYLAAMDAIRKTTEMLKETSVGTLYEFCLWDYNGAWFPGDDDAEPLTIGLVDTCQPPLAGAEPSRTECEMAHVSYDAIRWTAIVKHADVEVSTLAVSRTQLEEIAGT